MWVKNNVLFTLCLLYYGLEYINCKYEVIPERVQVSDLNPKYVAWGRVNVRRYSRQSLYYINFEGETLQAWTNNVTIRMIFYQFLSNEYRRSFVELHYKFCDMVDNDPFIGQILRLQNVKCPLPPKQHHFMNVTVPTESFHNKFPFEKTRINITAEVTATKERIFLFCLFATVKEVKKSIKGKS